MPTTVTKSIRASGGDYTTIQAWEDACPADLVSADQIWKGELYKEGGGTDNEWLVTSTIAIGGSTVDGTRYLWLTTPSGASFYDHASKLSNALRYNPSNGVAVRTNTNYQHTFDLSSTVIRITGLQLANTQGSARATIKSDGSSALFLERSIVANAAPFDVITCGFGDIKNSLIYTVNTGADAYGISFLNGVVASSIVNCTLHGGGHATPTGVYFSSDGQHIVKNCAVFNFGSFSNNASFANTSSSSNNATNLASIGFGSSNQTSLTTSAQFEATGVSSEDFRAKATGALAGNGVRAQTYTGDIDIVGSSRSTTVPYIGAWENAPAPPPNAPTSITIGSITPSGVTVGWTDASSDETGFKVQYAAGPGFSSWSTAGGSPTAANATSLAITGLSNATSYKARVASTNAAGDSSWVESVEFTTQTPSKLRPTADITVGSWVPSTGSTLYGVLDEASPDDGDNATLAGTGTMEVKFAPGLDPNVSYGHTVRYRVQGDGARQWVARLVQGTTVISTDATRTPPSGGYTTYSWTLTDAEANAITDYTDLRLRITVS